MVLVRKPALIKQIFAKNADKTFDTGFIGSRNNEVAQHTISLTAQKDLWKSNRQTLLPFFATSRLSGEASSKFTKQIRPMLVHLKEAHRTGNPVNATQIAINFMMDGVSNSLFSLNDNSYEKPGDLRRMLTDGFSSGLMSAICMYAQMQFPGAQMFEPLRLMGKKRVDSMRNIIRQQMERRDEFGSEKNNFVDLLMGLNNGGNGRKQDSEITNQMIGLGFTAAFAGKALGLSYTTDSLVAINAIHLLSLHPEYQEQIRNEVTQVMRSYKTSELTYEVVQDLRFTEQCIYETARLYPTSPFLTRLCSEDFQVPGTDYTFKKGERLIIDPYSVHRDPEYFKKPDTFDPERFSPENKASFSPDSYLAFGVGPRRCPGGKLGVFRVATMLASLLHKFEIKPHSLVHQMAAPDFNPKIVCLAFREDMLVDVIPREIDI